MTAPDLESGFLGSEGSTPRLEAVRIDDSHGVRMEC